MAITLIPYLFAFSLVGINRQFGWFSWLGYNLDDGTVYLSWIRQAADGHFFQRNLFTTESQPSGQVNLFFLALGLVSRITTLEPITVWHGSRVLLGIGLLFAVYRLIERLLPGERQRKAAFLLVCFSAGFGWMPGLWQDLGQTSPVDVWQVEAVTFPTLYLNPLFIVSLLLMVGFLIGLLDSEYRIKPAILSGVCGFLLGNIHGYDVITLTGIWSVYIIARTLAHRRIQRNLLAPTLIAFIPAFISAGYQYYLLKSNPVFAARVNVQTLSPPLLQYILGFGLLIPLALAGAVIIRSRGVLESRSDGVSDAPTHPPIHPSTHPLHHSITPSLHRSSTPLLLLASWIVANLAVAYLPVSFQRKMAMGLHLPLCMLAGAAIGGALSTLSTPRWRLALGIVVLFTAFTNVRFLWRDIEFFQANVAQSLIQRPFLMEGERRALAWLRTNVEPETPIQPLPWIPIQETGRLDTTLAAFAPGLTGLPVAAGHWGETPNFGDAIKEWGRFARGMPTESASELLRRSGVRYVLSSQNLEPALSIPPAYFESVSPLLRRIPEASNDDAEVFEVVMR